MVIVREIWRDSVNDYYMCRGTYHSFWSLASYICCVVLCETSQLLTCPLVLLTRTMRIMSMGRRLELPIHLDNYPLRRRSMWTFTRKTQMWDPTFHKHQLLCFLQKHQEEKGKDLRVCIKFFVKILLYLLRIVPVLQPPEGLLSQEIKTAEELGPYVESALNVINPGKVWFKSALFLGNLRMS